ncbi:MAG: sigma-70 family RNA polymerase sigma factor [Oscillospiraceae bacterium]|nr:sigma-70 family RNA polymerase sigma factor [Oscillospiraceae bacterium]
MAKPLGALGAQTDEALAALVQQGEQSTEAFALLLQHTLPLIRARANAFAGRVGGDAHEDLLQEGLLGFLGAVSSYKPGHGARFRTYCAVCVNNRIVSALRSGLKNARFAAVSLKEEDLPPNAAAEDPQDIFLAMETTRRMMEVLHGQLTPLEKGSMEGYLAGEHYDEIARQLGTNAKAVNNALQRVRRKLKEFL